MEDKSTLLKQAEAIVHSHVKWAIGAGAIPVPVLDLIGITAIQIDMLKQLCRLYDINYSENQGKSIVSAIAGSTIARIGASLLKSIPVIGTFIGGLSMAAMAGTTTYAMGHAFIANLAEGKSLFDFNIEQGKQIFKQAFEKGKAFVNDLENKMKKQKNTEEQNFDNQNVEF